ncbi:MAG: glycosyltransferase [Victivallales bacterium]|nr:glycosyltransferase [Victivallales bacterium]
MNPPTFSFLMITFNQEATVGEALETALHQDTPRLEIVVCDDCSSDRTFEIAREIAEKYHGPHRVILHRNEQNLGIAANFQKAYELSSGDWLFMAAGDDVSLPDRCQNVARRIPLFPKALAFGCNLLLIDENGREYGPLAHERPLVLGAGICWNRRIFSQFPAMTARIGVEDSPLLPRIFFLNGTYVKLPELGVKYRVDGHSYTGEDRNSVFSVRRYFLKQNETLLRSIENRLEALQHLKATGYSIEYYEEHLEHQKNLQAKLLERNQQLHRELDVLGGSFGGKIRYCLQKDGKTSFAQRLRMVLASVRWLAAIKRALRPPKNAVEDNQILTVPSLPPGLQPVEIDTRFYLDNHFDYVDE